MQTLSLLMVQSLFKKTFFGEIASCLAMTVRINKSKNNQTTRPIGYVPQRIGRICNPSPQRQENNSDEIATFLAMTF